MQRFDDEIGRRRLLIDLSNLKVEEVEDYYLQELNVSEEAKKQQIKWLQGEVKNLEKQEEVYQWILAIKSKDKKLVGIIKVWETEPEQALLKIHIPNKNWIFKYGVQSIDQFIKSCKEKKYFSVVELERDNSIIEQYRIQKGMEGYKIKIA